MRVLQGSESGEARGSAIRNQLWSGGGVTTGTGWRIAAAANFPGEVKTIAEFELPGTVRQVAQGLTTALMAAQVQLQTWLLETNNTVAPR
jgi:hypothetical protein